MPKYAARSDSNQQDIMDALRAAGCSVRSIHRLGDGLPDILVGDPLTLRNYLFEAKMPGGRLTRLEQKFFDEWLGQKDIAYSAEDALKIIGRL